MPTDLKVQIITLALDHLSTIVMVLGTIGTLLAAVLGVYLKPKIPAAVLQSQLLLTFRNVAKDVMRSIAAKLQTRAIEIHAQYDADMKAAVGNRELEKAALDKWEAATKGLSDEAVKLGLEEIGHLAPPWMTDAAKTLRHILEEILPEIQALFRKPS